MNSRLAYALAAVGVVLCIGGGVVLRVISGQSPSGVQVLKVDEVTTLDLAAGTYTVVWDQPVNTSGPSITDFESFEVRDQEGTPIPLTTNPFAVARPDGGRVEYKLASFRVKVPGPVSVEALTQEIPNYPIAWHSGELGLRTEVTGVPLDGTAVLAGGLVAGGLLCLAGAALMFRGLGRRQRA